MKTARTAVQGRHRKVSTLSETVFLQPRILHVSLCLAGMIATVPVFAYDVGLTISASGAEAFAVSADGNTVVGSAEQANLSVQAVRFNTDGSTSALPAVDLSNGTTYNSFARGGNSDGTVIVGFGKVGPKDRAIYWSASKATPLPGISGSSIDKAFSYDRAYGVSADGKVIVGYSWVLNDFLRAKAWKFDGGSHQMVDLFGGSSAAYDTASAVAYAASADGAVLVGWSNYQNATNQAVVWSGSNYSTFSAIANTLGGTESQAYGVSGDGSVVVGYAATSNTNAAAGTRAFRTAGGTMTSLGVLPGDDRSVAYGISLDGKVIIGYSAIGNAPIDQKAFRWTQATGMQTIEDWLRSYSVAVTGQITQTAYSTSSDGSVVVGRTNDNKAFIARVTGNPTTPGTPGSGMIVLDSAFYASLSNPGEVTRSQLAGSATVFNGVHSLPLSYRIAKGQSTVWGAGDWGWYNQSDSDGTIGVAEVAGGYNFGPVQLNMSVGYERSKRDLSQNGELKVGGTYLYGEALAPIVGNL